MGTETRAASGIVFGSSVIWDMRGLMSWNPAPHPARVSAMATVTGIERVFIG